MSSWDASRCANKTLRFCCIHVLDPLGTLQHITLHYITLHDITLHYIANVTLHYMKLHYIIYMHTRIHKCIRPSVGPTVRLYEQIECVRILPTKRALACRCHPSLDLDVAVRLFAK